MVNMVVLKGTWPIGSMVIHTHTHTLSLSHTHTHTNDTLMLVNYNPAAFTKMNTFKQGILKGEVSLYH